MTPAPILLDYRDLAAEAETVILRHGLTPTSVTMYPEHHLGLSRVVVRIETAALLAKFADVTTRQDAPILVTRYVDDGVVRIEAGEFLTVPA